MKKGLLISFTILSFFVYAESSTASFVEVVSSNFHIYGGARIPGISDSYDISSDFPVSKVISFESTVGDVCSGVEFGTCSAYNRSSAGFFYTSASVASTWFMAHSTATAELDVTFRPLYTRPETIMLSGVAGGDWGYLRWGLYNLNDGSTISMGLSSNLNQIIQYGFNSEYLYRLYLQSFAFTEEGGIAWSSVQMTGLEAAPVPIPGAVWLLGSGLVGLIGLKRKYLG